MMLQTKQNYIVGHMFFNAGPLFKMIVVENWEAA